MDMVGKFLSPHEAKAYAVLRIVSGLMFSFHGMQKILGVLSTHPQPAVGSQMWVGGIIELVAGLLICVGLFTVIAAFVASGTMAVAYFQFHWKFQVDSNFFPGVNQGEMAVLYCFIFLYVACRGGGPWSIDSRRR
jgi:putative oxidoreductase